MKTVAFLLFALVATAGAGAYVLLARLDAPYRGFVGEEQFVDIPSGSSTASIGAALVGAGVIRDTLTYRVALWMSGDARRLKAGEYRFDQPMIPRDVLAKITRGDVAQIVVTFPEGLTIAEMSRIFVARGLGTAADFVSAAGDASLIRDLDPTARNLEGYLFPDTYALTRSTDAPALVRAMVDRFRRVLTADLRDVATARGLSVRQLVTLSSIVEKETGRSDERDQVAAVYANRLRIGMALQCDPTVLYALQLSGRFDGNLRKDDLQFDSPYNTYRYPGLPPGPIAAPGKASLEAALHPADTAFLYFVSRNDGSHEFARTLDEHNRNVQKFQLRYFRNRRLDATGR